MHPCFEIPVEPKYALKEVATSESCKYCGKSIELNKYTEIETKREFFVARCSNWRNCYAVSRECDTAMQAINRLKKFSSGGHNNV
jgi:hypothetical protein